MLFFKQQNGEVFAAMAIALLNWNGPKFSPFSVDRVINRHQGEQTMFLDILSWNGHFLGTFLVVLLPKNFHFSFTSHLIGFADLPIITTKKREILTDTRKRASREKAPVNVRSTSECDTSECVEHKWMCEAHVNVRSTSHCLFFGHPPACKPQQLQQVGVYYIFINLLILKMHEK